MKKNRYQLIIIICIQIIFSYNNVFAITNATFSTNLKSQPNKLSLDVDINSDKESSQTLGIGIFYANNTIYESIDKTFPCSFPKGSLFGLYIINRSFLAKTYINPYLGFGATIAYYTDDGEINNYYPKGNGLVIGIPVELGININIIENFKLFLSYDLLLSIGSIIRGKPNFCQLVPAIYGNPATFQIKTKVTF
ncbi:MAG TPA: hypothetical protein DF296_12075 [Candidatus Margulisbacteria bacterium]|nr:hypothetical protein [Candidatus Margulisiibacteriota bacterium]